MSHAAYRANFSSITRQTRPEDIANSLTHGLGLLLAIGGTSVLVVFASIYGSVWHVVSFSIYGATLMLLFATSTVYHATRHLGRKKTLQIVDHASIFLLIAGTYTPFTFVPLNGGWGWSLFGVVWGLSAVGICAGCDYQLRQRQCLHRRAGPGRRPLDDSGNGIATRLCR